MKKKDLKEIWKQEIELEASALERRVNTKKSLASLEMPEDSYEDLMARIRAKKEQEPEFESKSPAKIIPFPTSRKKALATVAMVAVLVVGAGLGVNGARLYMLNVKRENGKSDITADTDDIFYVELTEEEAYEKIEEEIGILALRLINKPKEMELVEVFIDPKMGEALMEFHNGDYILTIYENKQNDNASFNVQSDGKVVDTIEAFYLEKELKIIEVDKSDGIIAYQAQVEYGNAFYCLSGDMELKEFEAILNGIIFQNN